MKSKNRNLLIISYDRDHSNNDLKKADFISRIFPKAVVNEYLDGCSIFAISLWLSAIFRWFFYFLVSHSHNYELN